MTPRLRALHQFVPSFSSRDAIGGHVIQVQRALRDYGLESEIYVVDARSDVDHLSKHYRKCVPDHSGESAIMYHLSVGSEMAKHLLGRPEPLVVDYHNITPGRFLDCWHYEAAYSVTIGAQQVPTLAPRTSLAIADSAFNAADLEAAGYRQVGVVPILLDAKTFERGIDHNLSEKLRNCPGSRWLFVGRIVPNKAQHDLIKAFAMYRRLYDPQAHLDIVGGMSSVLYQEVLEQMVGILGLDEAVSFTGSVSDSELGAYYDAADVLVCLSDHEGFCVPLIESMHNSLPIIAFEAGAVPETLGTAGLVLEDKTPARVAAAVHKVLNDERLRDQMIASGHERMNEFSLDSTRRRLIEALSPIIQGS